ncbi:MAG: putative Ig domain-containing protein, partial [Candidatus Krumholzibacteria bacterium]|nr:putative Ig domain-containing protein [Candidatus Krumholzibacteria bacterium]
RVRAAGPARGRGVRRAWTTALVLCTLAAAAYAGMEKGWLPRVDFLAVGNHPPSLQAPARLRVAAGERVAFALRAHDTDGDAVTFAARDLPSGARLNGKGEFAWPVGVAQAGVFEIAFTADDGRATAEAVTVVEVAAAALEFAPVEDIAVTAGRSAARRLRAASASGTAVTFALAEGPDGMRVEGDRLVYRAPGDVEGDFAAKVVASDGASSAERTIAVHVEPPAAAQGADGKVEWKLPEKADIYVDGAIKKRGADALALDLPPGRHTLRAELASGVVGWSKVVDVRAGETTRIRAPALAYGALSVYFLGAVGELQVNGKTFAQQPPFSGVKIPAGEHVVSCHLSGEEGGKELTVRVEAGRETVIEYEVGKEPVVTIEG